ncbi:MAG: CRISPR system precrRNA processing endoribonuclease RAMP protein Cas6 [Anaerolineae bacterium]|nr:CRISPR system precrRNA processing endoribonuclease RAMP protein Cas6 [Anaerolineae bacterium]
MTVLALPPNFTLVYYRFTMTALQPLHLPTYKGVALRGGLGQTLKKLTCNQPWTCEKACPRGNDCPYGYIFETSPPDGAEVLRNFSEVPRPFVIEPPRDRRETILPGEQLSFGLILIGHGMNYFPYFLAVFRELGWQGLGQGRGQYELNTIDAISPLDGVVEPVYRADRPEVRMTRLTPTSQAITDYAASLPAQRLTVEFLTTTQLKHQDRMLEVGPPFAVLVKALLSRVSSLSYFHCWQRFETDFRGWIDRAAAVRLVQDKTYQEAWSRFSTRQTERIDRVEKRKRIEMGGLLGQVTYEGDLAPYLPLLVLGQLIHVGKKTVFGNGQYRIMEQ